MNLVSAVFVLQGFRVRAAGRWPTLLLRSVPPRDQLWKSKAPTNTHPQPLTITWFKKHFGFLKWRKEQPNLWLWRQTQTTGVVWRTGVLTTPALLESKTWERKTQLSTSSGSLQTTMARDTQVNLESLWLSQVTVSFMLFPNVQLVTETNNNVSTCTSWCICFILNLESHPCLSFTDLSIQRYSSSHSQTQLRCHSSCQQPYSLSYIWYQNGQQIPMTSLYYLFPHNYVDSVSCALQGHERFSSPSVCEFTTSTDTNCCIYIHSC